MSSGVQLPRTFLHLGHGFVPEVVLLFAIRGKASPSVSQQLNFIETEKPSAVVPLLTKREVQL